MNHERGTSRADHRPDGRVTRGTTNINRLRRVDRWMAHDPSVVGALQATPRPLVIDLGYGARPDTCVEMAHRLRPVAPDLRMVGLEIDPERVVADRDGVRFAVGGFELAGLRPTLVRAFNVLRQYDETEVGAAWARMRARLAPGGLIVEGTCDEIGRRCTWVLLDADGPRSLTLCWSPRYSERPSDLAERLPKALIHRNVAGERIHDLLVLADRCWDNAAGQTVFGPRARWDQALLLMRQSGVDVEIGRRRSIDNRLTVRWEDVAPRG